MNYSRFTTYLILITGGFFLNNFYEWLKGLFVQNQLISNGIDFLGNIIVAISSAAIAYIISNHQLKKSKMEMEFVRRKETVSKIQLIKLEMNTNKKVIQNIKKSGDYDYAIKTSIEKLSFNIWENVYLNLDIKESVFTSVYNLYYKMGLLKSINESEFASKEFYDLIIKDIDKVTKDISDEIELIGEEISSRT